VDAALNCAEDLGLWACLACLRHGLLSKVDTAVSDAGDLIIACIHVHHVALLVAELEAVSCMCV